MIKRYFRRFMKLDLVDKIKFLTFCPFMILMWLLDALINLFVSSTKFVIGNWRDILTLSFTILMLYSVALMVMTLS